MTSEVTRQPRGTEAAPVVLTAGEIDSEWLSAVLSTPVSGFEVRSVGTGQMAASVGVAAHTPDGDVPLYVKLPTADEGMRPLVHGIYRSEVSFYRDLRPTVAVRTPDCRYAAMGEADGEFTLVLDDVAPLVQADQIAGMSPELTRDCAVNLAGLHGPRWCDPTLKELDGLSHPTEQENRDLQEMAGPCVEGFLAELGDRLTPEERDTLSVVPELVGDWANGRGERFAPVHGDYRADNMLVDPSGSLPSMACDWQTLLVALPGRDLGYLVATSLSVDERRAHEREIVGAYHEALRGYGVDVDLDTCLDDYACGLLQVPVIGLFGWMYGTRTDRGDEMFTTMIRRAAIAMADNDALDVVRAG